MVLPRRAALAMLSPTHKPKPCAVLMYSSIRSTSLSQRRAHEYMKLSQLLQPPACLSPPGADWLEEAELTRILRSGVRGAYGCIYSQLQYVRDNS